jgi:hypothetical protein
MESCLTSPERTPGDVQFCIGVLGSAEIGLSGAAVTLKHRLNKALLDAARTRLAPGGHPIPVALATSIIQTLTQTQSVTLLSESEKTEFRATLSSVLEQDRAQDPDQPFFPAERRLIEKALVNELGAVLANSKKEGGV